jgi:rRNA biogenesis protein RRP5
VFPAVTVRSIEPESRTVRVVLPDGSHGAITAAHVSDHPETGAALVGTLKSGDEIGPVVVLESGKPGKGRRAVLSRKQTLVSFASREALPETVADVAVGASYPGYVASVASGGVFVRFLGRLTGLCPPSGFQSSFSGVAFDASDRFALGQTVVARVTAVDATASPPRVSLTLAGAGGSKREQKTKTAAKYDEVDADPDSFLVRAVFADAEALDVLAEKRFAESSANGETETETGQAVALTRESVQSHFAPGSRLGVVATAIKPYGVLAEAAEDDDAVCLLANAQTPATSSLRSQPSKKSKSKSKTNRNRNRDRGGRRAGRGRAGRRPARGRGGRRRARRVARRVARKTARRMTRRTRRRRRLLLLPRSARRLRRRSSS